MKTLAGNRPKLFIGSASESLPIVQWLEKALAEDADIKKWTDRSVFKPLRQCLVIVPDSPQIHAIASPSVSPEIARSCIDMMRDFMRLYAERST